MMNDKNYKRIADLFKQIGEPDINLNGIRVELYEAYIIQWLVIQLREAGCTVKREGKGKCLGTTIYNDKGFHIMHDWDDLTALLNATDTDFFQNKIKESKKD